MRLSFSRVFSARVALRVVVFYLFFLCLKVGGRELLPDYSSLSLFSEVNFRGELLYSVELGKLRVSNVYTASLKAIFCSGSKNGYYRYLGEHWSFPFLESRAVLIEENVMLVYTPWGDEITLLKQNNNIHLWKNEGSQWFGHFDEINRFCITNNKLILNFCNGHLQSLGIPGEGFLEWRKSKSGLLSGVFSSKSNSYILELSYDTNGFLDKIRLNDNLSVRFKVAQKNHLSRILWSNGQSRSFYYGEAIDLDGHDIFSEAVKGCKERLGVGERLNWLKVVIDGEDVLHGFIWDERTGLLLADISGSKIRHYWITRYLHEKNDLKLYRFKKIEIKRKGSDLAEEFVSVDWTKGVYSRSNHDGQILEYKFSIIPNDTFGKILKLSKIDYAKKKEILYSANYNKDGGLVSSFDRRLGLRISNTYDARGNLIKRVQNGIVVLSCSYGEDDKIRREERVVGENIRLIIKYQGESNVDVDIIKNDCEVTSITTTTENISNLLGSFE